METVLKAIKHQTKLFSAIYGQEHLDERTEAEKRIGDLHDTYEEFPFLSFHLVNVWGKWFTDTK